MVAHLARTCWVRGNVRAAGARVMRRLTEDEAEHTVDAGTFD